jgi:hypothetical protein
MPANRSDGSALLQRAYDDLDLRGEDLQAAASSPAGASEPAVWGELGDWLLLGERVGVQQMFFLGGNPVLVFSTLPSAADEREIMALYRRAWCMARPRCLFVALHGELRVYALDEPPVAPGELGRSIEPLEVVKSAGEVGRMLARFHRDRLQSGVAFEDAELSKTGGRAEERLLRDVRAAIAALINGGLAPRHAHALIERAILIRYLEDRRVLTEDYFQLVAAASSSWRRALSEPDGTPDLGRPSSFIRCLADHGLTYALFVRLAEHFNGDLFVPDPDEHDAVTPEHLRLLRDLLQGVADSSQEPLFLWAYDFAVVPTSLVSSMYELFYNHQDAANTEANTHYTPPELVEFMLADVLPPDVLDRQPRVCDPACGSGIFLVEAFRRIVRHEAAKTGKPPSTARLRTLLVERIAGCDIDASAVRLAAFSLYVAFLNYQSPQDILKADPLPALIHRADGSGPPAPLVVADAFSPTEPADEERQEGQTALPWRRRSFGLVVGNPPWSEPRGAAGHAERWARERKLAVGDRSPSQLFLWRALDLLAGDGVGAMLISAKVLFNTRTTSQRFRTQWLSAARVQRVVNFSEVRREFFQTAVAPFALVRFTHADVDVDGEFVYETARRVPSGRRGSAALARLDRRVVSQRSLREQPRLWKVYSAGSHRDAALLARLSCEERLADLQPTTPKAQYGYQHAHADQRDAHPPDASWRTLASLKTFESWGPIRDAWLEAVSEQVKFAPDPALFLQRTLVVRRFVSPGFGPHARLLREPLAFRHTVYGIPMGHRPLWQAQLALGTLLSSLGRYWLYMVSGSWGTWKDEIRSEDLLDLPLRVDRSDEATARILTAVKRLESAGPAQLELSDARAVSDLRSIQQSLDVATMDLFRLSEAERDLVADFWASRAAQSTAPVQLDQEKETLDPMLAHYLDVFAGAWRAQLPDDVRLDARVWSDPQASVIAAEFQTVSADEAPAPAASARERQAWWDVLAGYDLEVRETRSGSLLTHGMVRAVAGHAIVLVKRNERRLFSSSAAREDAEATMAQAMALRRR